MALLRGAIQLSREERCSIVSNDVQLDLSLEFTRVAAFLLAWWNADTCGGFDLTDLWAVDAEIAQDMLVVIGLIARVREYPPALGFEAQFRRLVKDWRPELMAT